MGRRRSFPGGSDGKESACNVGDLGWEDPLEKSMDRGYSPWGHKELDMTERLTLLLSRGRRRLNCRGQGNLIFGTGWKLTSLTAFNDLLLVRWLESTLAVSARDPFRD